jgi:ribosomal protein L11 methyltransferase
VTKKSSIDLSNRPDGAAAWRVALTLPRHALEAVEAALEDHAAAVTTRTLEQGNPTIDGAPEDPWRLTAYCADAPAGGVLAALALAAVSGLGLATPEIDIAAVPETDWAAQNLEAFPLLFAGRFVVHGDHLRPPPGRVALCINAANAFGSGRHGSTRGCLLALDGIARERRITRALDLGTGSGILAVAIAKCWGGGGMGAAGVVAADNDPQAVAAARAAAAANGVAARVQCVLSDGFAAPALAAGAPYDLICANILADPLIGFAADLARHLAAGGIVILSGLLNSQEAAVTAAYERAGLRLVEPIRLGEWTSLVLTS